MLLRTCSFLLLAVCGSVAAAQAPAFHYFRTVAPVAPQQIKVITEAVMSADPFAEVFHSDDMTILQVKHTGNLSEAAARSAIVNSGLALQAGNPTAEELGLNAVDANAPPIFMQTGDDAGDLERYRMSVEQWNAVHPESTLSTTPIHRR